MNTFNKAADIIKGHFYKGNFTDDNGNYCAAGAVIKAKGGEVWADDTDDMIAERELELLNNLTRHKSDYLFISEYNDDPDTTEADIIALLNEAADIWDGEEHED